MGEQKKWKKKVAPTLSVMYEQIKNYTPTAPDIVDTKNMPDNSWWFKGRHIVEHDLSTWKPWQLRNLNIQ